MAQLVKHRTSDFQVFLDKDYKLNSPNTVHEEQGGDPSVGGLSRKEWH